MYLALLHSHVSSWFLGIFLFILALIFIKLEMPKGKKITHMILRVFYIIILITGVSLLVHTQFPISHIIKGLLALWLISIVEMYLARNEQLNRQSKLIYWLQIIIALVFIFLIGYRVI